MGFQQKGLCSEPDPTARLRAPPNFRKASPATSPKLHPSLSLSNSEFFHKLPRPCFPNPKPTEFLAAKPGRMGMLLGGDKKVDPRMHWKDAKTLAWGSWLMTLQQVSKEEVDTCLSTGGLLGQVLFSWQPRKTMHPSSHVLREFQRSRCMPVSISKHLQV